MSVLSVIFGYICRLRSPVVEGLLLQVQYQGQVLSPMLDLELAAQSKGPREGGKVGKCV